PGCHSRPQKPGPSPQVPRIACRGSDSSGYGTGALLAARPPSPAPRDGVMNGRLEFPVEVLLVQDRTLDVAPATEVNNTMGEDVRVIVGIDFVVIRVISPSADEMDRGPTSAGLARLTW